MPTDRPTEPFSALEAGPYSPLQALERSLTGSLSYLVEQERQHMDQALPQLNMADINNAAHQTAAGRGRSSSLNNVVASPRKGSAMWPTKWRRGTRNVTQPSTHSGIRSSGRDRAPSLLALPKFPRLPNFAEGNYGEEKSLPGLPASEHDNYRRPNNAYQESITDGEPFLIRRIKGKKVLLNVRGRDKSPPATSSADHLQKYLADARARASSTAENPRRMVLPPHEARSFSTPELPRMAMASSNGQVSSPKRPIPRKPVATGSPLTPAQEIPITSRISPPTPPVYSIERAKQLEILASSANSDMCQSPSCPIQEPHRKGLYLEGGEHSQWRHPYWGISNPPQRIWIGWDRRTDKIATPQEESDILGFIVNHAFGPRGKVKEIATAKDYEESKKERGGGWAGKFF